MYNLYRTATKKEKLSYDKKKGNTIMNTNISLVAELELTDVELEAVVGGRGSLIGSISILNSYSPDSGNTFTYNNSSTNTNSGNFGDSNGTNSSNGYTAGNASFNNINSYYYKKSGW